MLKKTKIGTRLLVAFIIVSLFAVGMGISSSIYLARTLKGYQRMYDEQLVCVQKLGELSQLYQKTRVAARDIMLLEDPDDIQSGMDDLSEKNDQIDAVIAELKECLSEERLYDLTVLEESIINLRPLQQNAISFARAGHQAEGYTSLKSDRTQEAATAVQTDIDNLQQALVDDAQTNYESDYAQTHELIVINAGVACLAFIVSLLMGILLSKMIRRSIMDSVKQLSGMADGENLEALRADDYSGEFVSMAQSMNDIRESLYLLRTDIVSLSESAMKGRLSERIDVKRHKGGYREIVNDINGVLDAVIAPVNEARDVLMEIAQGNLGVRVTGSYQGDHAAIKDAVNTTVEALNLYIGEVSDVLSEMSKGNLDVAINTEFKGGFIKLKDSINGIIDALNTFMDEINASAEQVSAGTLEVSAGGQQISQGATEQASAIEELTASITSIAEQTRQNALAAGNATELAGTTKENAVKGNEEMQNMLGSMNQISEAAKSIYKITKAIDEIAFQTNILALNAAVEAARVGVHGKGFAVVAGEVRNLAAKSAQAAQETGELIAATSKRTEAGSEIAGQTAQSLEKIMEDAGKTANLVREIAVSSNEQATGISQINKGIEQMSQVVQANSATAEQSAAASQELAAQANILKDMVGRFTLKSSHKDTARVR